ncbi:MAG TPA: hypothetical protein P5079_07185, partial [Elusimicrobiota bacterium]|nr:hypothetical protein [Elusimicrobiota bacterium]
MTHAAHAPRRRLTVSSLFDHLTPETLWAASLGGLNLLTRRMGDESRYRWARRISRTARWVAPGKWYAVESNLALVNRWAGAHFQTHKVFENFVLTLSDFLSGAKPVVHVEGREKAEAARAVGKGAVFLTSHLGHWELGGRILADWGWPVTAVYQPYRSAAMHDFIHKRRSPGLRYLAVGKGAA